MNNIMFQGTASNVGKSIISAGICRVLWQDGYRVGPFKSQNMSLNSYIDKYGGEMGRAQVFQAEACNIEPRAYMNPILLKPSGNNMSQLVMKGKFVKNISSSDYQDMKEDLMIWLGEVYRRYQKDYEIVVLEGAGSPVEININKLDISNMEMARIADAPVVLVADIDRGGVFASIVGTLSLLSPNYKERVKGLIINKFRGNKESFQEGVKLLEEITKIPVLGVVPYQKLGIDEEDGVSEQTYTRPSPSYKSDRLNIFVLKLDHMSNYTDFNVFAHICGVEVSYIGLDQDLEIFKEGKLLGPDMLIIPGSKNTVGDMQALNNSPMKDKILDYVNRGGLIIGLCGGYQMLGKYISDEQALDGRQGYVKGLGILDVFTIFEKEKKTSQVNWTFGNEEGYFSGLLNSKIEGYETHLGRTYPRPDDNYVISKGHIMGTYCHGIFDSTDFLSGLLNNIAEKKGLARTFKVENYKAIKENEYNKLADLIRNNIDMKKVYQIIFGIEIDL